MKVGEAIYLDHQATTPVDPRVLTAMDPYLRHEFGNPHSADHAFGWRTAKAVEQAAASVAELIGADRDEIIFTSGATEANNLALMGLARRAAGQHRKRILVSGIEHKCVLGVCRAIEEQLGIRIEKLPVERDGTVRLDFLESRLADDVLAVSVMAVNNEIGTIQPIETISTLVRRHGAVFHCDGAQAPCAIDLRGFARLVDSFSLSGHKMYGPKGVGVLYMRREHQRGVEPLFYGGGQQRNLRSGTVPVFLCVGMAAAASLIVHGDAAEERKALSRRLRWFVLGLQEAGLTIQVNGPAYEKRHPGNANLQLQGFSAHDVLGALQPTLAASTGSACTTGIPEPSHVLQAIGLTDAEVDSSIRFSLGRYTTDEDVQDAIRLVAGALSRLSENTPPAVARVEQHADF